MAKQLMFSQKVVDALRINFEQSGGDEPYLKKESFASSLETLISPTIEAPLHLKERINPQSDIETAIALYESYPTLNPLEASSVGFWTYLTHVDLWDYMQRRFSLSSEEESDTRRKKIKEKWFLGDPSQSNLIHHPIAGLWWGVKLSVVPERGDGRYDLTRILYRNLDLPTRTLGTYQLGRLPNAIRGILGYVYDHEDDFKNEYEAKMRHIMKHFNSIGGVLALGCLEQSFYVDELDRTKDEWMLAKKHVASETEGVPETQQTENTVVGTGDTGSSE